MSLLSPRLQLRVAQKQILTPGLVQMVTVLQLNRLELREMITQEIAENPVLEEATDEAGEELSPEEVQQLLEAERVAEPADQSILEATNGDAEAAPEALAESEAETACRDRKRASRRDRRAGRVQAGHRSVRGDRLRLLLGRLPRPRLQESVLRAGRQALLRDLPARPGHLWRLPAVAVDHGAAGRGRAGRRRLHYRQPG